MARYSWLALALVACGGQTESTGTPATAPSAPATPAPSADIARSPCDPFAAVEEQWPLGPYAFAGRASDGTVYAINGTDFDVRVFVSGQNGVLRWQRLARYAASGAKNEHLQWDLENGTRLYITVVVLAGDARHVPIAISRDGKYEELAAIPASEVLKLDVRKPVPATPYTTAVEADGSRFLLVYREYYGEPPNGRYTAFYGQPPTIAERKILEWEYDNRFGNPISVTLDIDGSPLKVPVTEDVPLPAAPGAGPSADPTHGFASGLTFTCR